MVVVPNEKDGTTTIGVVEEPLRYWGILLVSMLGVGLFWLLLHYRRQLAARFPAAVLAVVLGCCLWFSWRGARHLQAVADGLDTLAQGGAVQLPTTGFAGELAEKLNPGSRLRATALGGGKTVLKAVGSIPGIRKVEIESEADGQVTFTAESADASDRRAEVSRALSQAGCTVLALAAENRTLEEVFLALTENESETPSDEGEEKTE